MYILMSSIRDFSLPEAYESIRRMDKLPEIDRSIEWNALVSLVRSLFHNDTERGGRPNFDEIVMIKTLFLQGLYNISDEMLEKELYDRISFRNFLHYPDKMPDARTIWLFRERLSSSGMDNRIWSEIWKQLESHGIAVKKGVIQDASIISTDQGKHGRKKPPVPFDVFSSNATVHEPADQKETGRIGKAMKLQKKLLRTRERKYSLTRRSKDGTFVNHNGKNYFGYKIHTAQSVDNHLILRIVVTTASVHDSQVDLSMPGIVCYRDRGYQGAPCRGVNGTMKRSSVNTPLTIDEVRRNGRISRKRVPGERPYSILKRVQNHSHTFVTMVRRVRVRMVFACLAYNFLTISDLRRRGVIA